MVVGLQQFCLATGIGGDVPIQISDAGPSSTLLTDAAGYTSSYSYDSLNRLTGLTNTNSGSFGFGYDALGRRTSLTRPNGVNTSYGYDTLSRLLSVVHNGGNLPGSTSYSYDAAGNRTSKTALQQADPNPISVTSNYSYDNIYALTQAVVNGSVAEGYSYDAVGNRLSSAGPVSYNYNASNELTSTSAATYSYDNNGNTLSKTTTAGTTSYTWDFENRLASVTLPGTGGTVNFKYDPFGKRIEKVAPTTGTTIYAYDGANITGEVGAGGNLLAYYTQGAGIDEPLATGGTGGTYFYHGDGLGSITSLTGGSGQLANSYVYDSFGNLTASTGTVTNPFQYTAREFDSETGVYYYRARYYDSISGRFLREDPIRFKGGTNFYAYVHNRPVGLTDPQGLCVDQEKLANCISSLFGVATVSFSVSTEENNGSFTGEMAGVFNGAWQPLLPGPFQFTVTNITSMTVGMLSTLYGGPAARLTSSNMPFMNWTGWDQSTAHVQQTQIYELGNSLGFITGQQLPASNAFNVELGPANNEPGKLLLDCYMAQ